MQEGSIVIMEKPVEWSFKEACKQFISELGKMPPEPGDTQYMVTGLASKEECRDAEIKFGIYLDAYPTYEKAEIPFDGDLFIELLPPNLNVDQLFDEVPEKRPVRELVSMK
jgi:hypothetical protein